MGNTDKFDMIANTYDTPERIQLAHLSAQAIEGYLVKTEDKRAIDFGCGTGLVGLQLLHRFQSVLFLDSSPNMIDQIKRKVVGAGIGNAEIMCFDFEKDSPSDLRGDYIFMAQVLLHISDVTLVLSRLYNVLCEGGHLLIVDFNKNENVVSPIVHHGFNQTELADIMHKIGYQNIQSQTFYSGKKIFMGQDATLFVLDAQK